MIVFETLLYCDSYCSELIKSEGPAAHRMPFKQRQKYFQSKIQLLCFLFFLLVEIVECLKKP